MTRSRPRWLGGLLALLAPMALASGGAEPEAVGAQAVRLSVTADIAANRAGVERWVTSSRELASSDLLDLVPVPDVSRLCDGTSPIGGGCGAYDGSLRLVLGATNGSDALLGVELRVTGTGLAAHQRPEPATPPGIDAFAASWAPQAGGDPGELAFETPPLLPGETRSLHLVVYAAEGFPDARLELELTAVPLVHPVEVTRVLLESDLAAGQDLQLPARGDAPGVHVPGFAVAEDGRLRVEAVDAPTLLALLPPGVEPAAPLYRVSAVGVRGGGYGMLLSSDLAPAPVDGHEACWASYSMGRWYLSPARPAENGSLEARLGGRQATSMITLVRSPGSCQ